MLRGSQCPSVLNKKPCLSASSAFSAVDMKTPCHGHFLRISPPLHNTARRIDKNRRQWRKPSLTGNTGDLDIYDPFDDAQDMFTNCYFRFYLTFYLPLCLCAFVAMSIVEKTKPICGRSKLAQCLI